MSGLSRVATVQEGKLTLLVARRPGA